MTHYFEKQPILEGKAFVIETCECGAQSRRFKKGKRYYLVNGFWTPTPAPCTREVEKQSPKKKPIPPDDRLVVCPDLNSNSAYFNCGGRSIDYMDF